MMNKVQPQFAYAQEQAAFADALGDLGGLDEGDNLGFNFFESIGLKTPALAATLSEGMGGDNVKTAQKKLGNLGYGVSATGIFGPDMTTAVRSFQLAQGLTVNGKVDALTWQKLHKQSLGAGAASLATSVAQGAMSSSQPQASVVAQPPPVVDVPEAGTNWLLIGGVVVGVVVLGGLAYAVTR
jgi:murein L,D-transpeptidase YcbB/YkuD